MSFWNQPKMIPIFQAQHQIEERESPSPCRDGDVEPVEQPEFRRLIERQAPIRQ